MIKNYGLFWKRVGVHWNAGGRRGAPRGHLKGEATFDRATWVVDFREQIGIYCLYDENFRLLYVGQAGFGNATLFERLRSHTQHDLAERWTRFSWFGLKSVGGEAQQPQLEEFNEAGFGVRDVLNSLEGILIVGAEPPLNRQGPSFGDAEKYKQHWDDGVLNPPVNEMIREIWEKLPGE